MSAHVAPAADVITDLLDRAPCGFVTFDDGSRITHVNGTLLERLGYASGDLVGSHFETILAMGSRIFHQTHFFPLLRLHGHAEEIFLLLRTRHGEDVGMLCNAQRRARDGAEVTDCVFLEVRERRKFEEALLQAKRAADEANKAKSTFLTVMSHELRTPLNAIGGYTQLLEMEVHGPVTEAQREALARIDRSQRHLLRLINDVLNLARIEAGRVDYVMETVGVSEVVAAVLPMIEPQAAARNQRVVMEVPAGIAMRTDREKVQQIVLNLLTNAVKFTAEGGSIRVEAGGRPEKNEACVRVTDTGSGVPADMLDRIFERFVQVDTTLSGTREGTGLGLAISRDLARGMGGDITATSTPGVGSTFELVLPAASTE